MFHLTGDIVLAVSRWGDLIGRSFEESLQMFCVDYLLFMLFPLRGAEPAVSATCQASSSSWWQFNPSLLPVRERTPAIFVQAHNAKVCVSDWASDCILCPPPSLPSPPGIKHKFAFLISSLLNKSPLAFRMPKGVVTTTMSMFTVEINAPHQRLMRKWRSAVENLTLGKKSSALRPQFLGGNLSALVMLSLTGTLGHWIGLDTFG